MSFSSGPSGQTARPLPGPVLGASSSLRRGGPPGSVVCFLPGASLTPPRPRCARPAPRRCLPPFREPHICLSLGRERAPSPFWGPQRSVSSLGVTTAGVAGVTGRSCGGQGRGAAAGHGFWPWRENMSLVPELQAGGLCRSYTSLPVWACPPPSLWLTLLPRGAGVRTAGTKGQTSFRGAGISCKNRVLGFPHLS